MTAKVKAEQIIFEIEAILCPKFENGNNEYVKKCALISVDETIKETMLHDLTIYQHGRTAYWQEVKEEIKKL